MTDDVAAVLAGERAWAVVQGDCRALLRSLPDASVDTIITDPPYGMDLQPQRGKQAAIAGDKREEAQQLWRDVMPLLWCAAKPDSAHIFFGRWSEPWAHDVLSEYFTIKGCIVWKKTGWGIGYYLRPQWELMWYCHKGNPPPPERADGDVWTFARDQELIHSCQKPVALLRRAVRLCSPRGGVVVDPFTGSGSTGIAAAETGHSFIGCEVDAGHARTSRMRVDAAYALEAARLRLPFDEVSV